MPDYRIAPIDPGDRAAQRRMEALLAAEGIRRDRHLEYSAGLFDSDGELAATGSCYRNTLRCLAVRGSSRGERLLAPLLSHLIEYQYGRGRTRLFLTTKCDTAQFFSGLGFWEVARAPDAAVLMENRADGLASYAGRLRGLAPSPDAAIVMNANPFTLGHQYLVERAAAECASVLVLVVEEDVSLVPFAVRCRLVKDGCAHLPGVTVASTGPYQVSSATFPSYFLPEESGITAAQAGLDAAVFCRLARELGIRRRFLGEEPFSAATGIYNRQLREKLAESGIACAILPRLEAGGAAVSASRVRSLIQAGAVEAVRALVPPATFRFFTSPEGAETVAAIRCAEKVVHH